jgi:hypothetical protein
MIQGFHAPVAEADRSERERTAVIGRRILDLRNRRLLRAIGAEPRRTVGLQRGACREHRHRWVDRHGRCFGRLQPHGVAGADATSAGERDQKRGWGRALPRLPSPVRLHAFAQAQNPDFHRRSVRKACLIAYARRPQRGAHLTDGPESRRFQAFFAGNELCAVTLPVARSIARRLRAGKAARRACLMRACRLLLARLTAPYSHTTETRLVIPTGLVDDPRFTGLFSRRFLPPGKAPRYILQNCHVAFRSVQ